MQRIDVNPLATPLPSSSVLPSTKRLGAIAASANNERARPRQAMLAAVKPASRVNDTNQNKCECI